MDVRERHQQVRVHDILPRAAIGGGFLATKLMGGELRGVPNSSDAPKCSNFVGLVIGDKPLLIGYGLHLEEM